MVEEKEYKGCSFYVQAHQDDWQLFRGEVAWYDVTNSSNKVTFIYTTAGDEGFKNGWWESRERGAIESIRSILPKQPVILEIININGHPIVRYRCKNTSSYFMRLPGCAEICSLKELALGSPSCIAVDNSTSYSSWTDFMNTLKEIIDRETPKSLTSKTWINISEPNPKVNPGDNPDHFYTSLAVLELLKKFEIGRRNVLLYQTYCTKDKKDNIEVEILRNKRDIFDAYKKEFLDEMTKNGGDYDDLKGGCEWEWGQWGNKSYARTLPIEEGDEQICSVAKI